MRKRNLLVNLMSSPGSGKTTTLKKTIAALNGKLSLAVMKLILIQMLMLLLFLKQG